MRISFKGRVACSWFACLSACAGGTRSANAPEHPATAAAPANQPVESAAGAQKSAAPSADSAARDAPGAADPHSSSARARTSLAEARREVEIGAGERDCARACRALESMERAARQICELARAPEERTECASAGEQVDKARTKVQNACGGCSQKMR
jgi:hypothetical protein